MSFSRLPATLLLAPLVSCLDAALCLHAGFAQAMWFYADALGTLLHAAAVSSAVANDMMLSTKISVVISRVYGYFAKSQRPLAPIFLTAIFTFLRVRDFF